ncbi:hypothetical protein QRD89_06405 [Halobacillus sp. ACCC02827]|uniref:hypothetical protein n=1 Tax=Bacillaceae TaxID=186817 RepID=UPI00040CD317|nr:MULTISPECIES: hypothetical protein [Bacillaceae]QHT46160.1 hypothetical protein M662_06530 [Bacillus sp. SB49]WJE16974.1 hypothetical protein QRD89_06405 [Halobacillus sp. ACCC02827]
MKKTRWMLGVLFVLAACQNSQASSGLTVKPAELSEEGEVLAKQIYADFKMFYTLDGSIGEDEVVVASMTTYENGKETAEALSTFESWEGGDFEEALHSFQLLRSEEGVDFIIGSPEGYVASSHSGQGEKEEMGYIFQSLEQEETLEKGRPLYVGYVKGSTGNSLEAPGIGDAHTFPEDLKQAEEAIVLELQIKNKHDIE